MITLWLGLILEASGIDLQGANMMGAIVAEAGIWFIVMAIKKLK